MENNFAARSSLIAPELEEQLKGLLSQLTADAELTALVDQSEKSLEMAAFLNHITALSPRLTCRFLSPEEAGDLGEQLNSSLLPATGIGAPGEPPRMVFHGVPGGKEISSFAMALLNAGAGTKPLDKYTLKDIAKIKKPMLLEICVSLGCHHCAQLVAAAQRIAWENPLVTAHMIDANLYPELVKKYQIERVPLLIVDGTKTFPGGKTLAELTSLLSKMK